MLISHGHPPADVFGYSVRQAVAFSRLCEARERRERRGELDLIRTAYHADPKAYRRALQELDDGDG